MAATYIPIASTTLTTSAASVTFSSIPQTYTDLVIKISARASSGFAQTIRYTINSSTSSLSQTNLESYAGTVTSEIRTDNQSQILVNGSTSTADTFNNAEIYFPNYTSSTNKPFSVFTIMSNNSTTGHLEVVANLRSSTAAITDIQLACGTTSSFVSGSSFHLYGIKNS